MKVYREISIEYFQGWSGAQDTIDKIIHAGMAVEFDTMIEELHPDGIDETELNDILMFEDDWVFETLGISDEDDEE